ncbi:BglG family transcription antiterminator [Brevibacillus migulae]|uniref:BglG family transcription antiterminator n=1 Tax=Brevibacillus migulae TaxID=1644114 RepID=UPI00106E4EAB|nr:BglG family transcription antiterminator [Brevibacillus migulae]
MRFSSRQKMILAKLLQEPKEITIREIADEIEVSTRTVHRELDELEPALGAYKLALRKKIGIGVQLHGEPESKEALRQDLFQTTPGDFSPHERKMVLFCTLLGANEPVKLISLAHDLKVTTATVSHDLDELEEKFHQYGLQLVRRRGYGIELQGNEAAKRVAITSLISENLNEYEVIAAIKDSIQQKTHQRINSVSERLLGLIEKEKLIVVEKALRDLEQDLPYPLADSAFIGLVIHLALAIERVEKGENIQFHQEYLKQLVDTQEYQVAEKILQRLETLLQWEIPKDEIGYITMHLRGAKMRNAYGETHLSANVELMTKVKQLITVMEEKLQVDFADDQSLLQGLLTHMEPALFRIIREMRIRNPLVEQIKKDYEVVFAALTEAVQQVFPEFAIPEAEIGYLVMHFGAALERLHWHNERYRALIVCSSGIGSSKILASRIKKEIPEITALRNISLFEISQVPQQEYDVIISTIPLPNHQEDYILVSPLLAKDDIQKIKGFLKGIQRKLSPKRRTVRTETAAQTAILQLKAVHTYVTEALGLIDRFHHGVVRDTTAGLEATLREICEDVQATGSIADAALVVKQLLDREKLGGLGIPGTSLALFHCRGDQIEVPVFAVYQLPGPLRIRSMENDWIEIRTILLLLGPQKINKEALELMSEISSLFIEEEAIRLFGSGEEAEMKAYMAKRLRDYTSNRIRVEE